VLCVGRLGVVIGWLITESTLLKHNDTQVTKQIITLLEIILQQNYFSFEINLCQPEKGVSMGSHISNTMAEIFLQHIENTHLKELLDTKNIIFCTRYVDDILLMYDTKCVNSNTIHKYIKQIHPNLQLNPTHENNNCINFLDLLIIQTPLPPTWKLIYTGNPQPPTQLSTAYPTISLNTESQLTDTIAPECNHYR
jgi:hypothetical protein